MDNTKVERSLTNLKKWSEKNIDHFQYFEKKEFPSFFSEISYSVKEKNSIHTFFKKIFFSHITHMYPTFEDVFNVFCKKLALSSIGNSDFNKLSVDFGSNFNFCYNLTLNFVEYKISEFLEIKTSAKIYETIVNYIKEDNVENFCIKLICEVFDTSNLYLNYKGIFCVNKFFLQKFITNDKEFYYKQFLVYDENPENEFLCANDYSKPIEKEFIEGIKKLGEKEGWKLGKTNHLKILENWDNLNLLDSRLFLFDLNDESYSLLEKYNSEIIMDFKVITVKVYLMISLFEKWDKVNEVLKIVLEDKMNF